MNPSLKKKIRKLSPEAKAFIKDLKPYKGGNDAFWELHRLGIKDRHRLLFPVWAGIRSVGIKLIVPREAGQAPVNVPRIFLTPDDRHSPLEDGAEVFRANLANLGKTIDEEIHLIADIFFGDGDVVHSEPIGPKLVQLREFVDSVVKLVEKRFFTP